MPLAIDVLLAAIVIDCKVAAVTVNAIVFEVIPLCVALMLLVPVPEPVARPLELTVDTAVFDEFQRAVLVRF